VPDGLLARTSTALRKAPRTLSARALETLLGDWRDGGGSAYRALAEQREPELPALAIQYADYAEWELERLESGELDRARSSPDGKEILLISSESGNSTRNQTFLNFQVPFSRTYSQR
jgi:hypothetical protein